MTPPKRPLFVTPATRTVEIESSKHVAAVSYRPESQIMSVRFKNGDVYDYPDVDYNTAVGLATAKSVGSHLNTVIRKNFVGKKRQKA